MKRDKKKERKKKKEGSMSHHYFPIVFHRLCTIESKHKDELP